MLSALLSKLWSSFRPQEPHGNELLSPDAKRELATKIEAVLAVQYETQGGGSLLEPGLRVVVTEAGISLSRTPVDDAIASVVLKELNTVRSFLVVRTEHIAVPRDILGSISRDAAKSISRQIKALEAHNSV